MGGKRKKVKDVLSLSSTTPPPAPAAEDDELLDDLIAQLDSDDKTVQDTSAEVINEIQTSQLQENKESQERKKGSKTRFLERQVCMLPRFPKARLHTIV
jgi:OTU domain-containing protein 6